MLHIQVVVGIFIVSAVAATPTISVTITGNGALRARTTVIALC